MLQGSNGRTITSGNIMNFTTLPNEKPKVGNTILLSHGPTSAFVSYDILEDGGENITETGCYYELASKNTTGPQSEKENIEKELPSNNATKKVLTNYSGGLGQQKLLIDELTLNTTYKIWPYAKAVWEKRSVSVSPIRQQAMPSCLKKRVNCSPFWATIYMIIHHSPWQVQ